MEVSKRLRHIYVFIIVMTFLSSSKCEDTTRGIISETAKVDLSKEYLSYILTSILILILGVALLKLSKKKELSKLKENEKKEEKTIRKTESVEKEEFKKKKAEKAIFENLNIHPTGFSHQMDPTYDSKVHSKAIYPIKGEENDVIIVENLLSSQECKNLIDTANREGFLNVDGFEWNVRNNSRRRTFDTNMSQIMFERLKPFIPQHTIVIDGLHWELCRFLEFWRYLRYTHDQRFQTHYDGSKKFADEKNDIYEMSIYTLNIYLNDGFEKGGTRFYMDCKENAKVYDPEEAGPVTHCLQPKQGNALVFNHCNKGYLHDGEPLDVTNTSVKEKYLLRADLIYRLRKSDVPAFRAKIKDESYRFFKMRLAEDGLVEDYVGNTWKCACVNKHFQ